MGLELKSQNGSLIINPEDGNDIQEIILPRSGVYGKDQVYNKEEINKFPRVSTIVNNALLNPESINISNTEIKKAHAVVTYTGNGDTQAINTGISSVDFTQSNNGSGNNGSGYYHDRNAGDCIVKNDAGSIIEEGECKVNLSKVHIKCRSDAFDNIVFDGLRGVSKYIFTNKSDSEGSGTTNVLQEFNGSGVVLGNGDDQNKDGSTYMLYQTLYTHIRWGKTNHNRRFIEAYNPITKEGMIIYGGSGIQNHEIPHSMQTEIDFAIVKSLTQSRQWNGGITGSSRLTKTYWNAGSEYNNIACVLNTENPILSTYSMDTQTNGDGDVYIVYYNCNSETFISGTYVGDGSHTSIIKTKNLLGENVKLRNLIIKNINNIGSWNLFDTSRGDNLRLQLNDSVGEDTIECKINNGYFIPKHSGLNTPGTQYFYYGYIDTNASEIPDDTYYNQPTDNTNLLINQGNFSYTNGLDINGYKKENEIYTGTVLTNNDLEGLKWVGKYKNSNSYRFEDRRPNVGIYEKEDADDNRLVFLPETGKFYETSGGDLITNGKFDKNLDGWFAGEGSEISLVDNGIKVKVTDTTSIAWSEGKTLVRLKKGEKYKLKFTKTEDGGSTYGGYIAINNEIDFITEYLGPGNLGTFEYTFTAQTTGEVELVIRVREAGGDIGDYIVIDDISLFKAEPDISDTPIDPISFLPYPVYFENGIPQKIETNDMLPINILKNLEVVEDIKARNIYADNLFGQGYEWVDETDKKRMDVNYFNDSDYPIFVSVYLRDDGDSDISYFHSLLKVDNLLVDRHGSNSIGSSVGFTVSGLVPPKSYYRVYTISNGATKIEFWKEYRKVKK